MTAIALTIAGSDSGGGAGIQADLKTFSALGVYGTSVVTALTAQNTRGVQAIHEVPAGFVAAQLDSVLSDLAVDAVKIGMIARADIAEAVADGLDRAGAGLPVVLDPVMVATSGDRLIAADAVEALRRRLIPRAALLTPNLPEAAALLEERVATTEDEAADQGRRLLALGCAAVLVKGGHGTGHESVDLFVTGADVVRLPAPRYPTKNTHGTGCTLSAAVAAGVASGLALNEAVAAAKAYVGRAIAASDALAIGSGHGPVHHFHAVWR